MTFGSGTISSVGSAVNDLFAADAHRSKATGLGIEAKNYDRASEFANQNARFTEQSTAIKQFQTDRDIYKTIGGQQADVAAAGFAASGSALDIMRAPCSSFCASLAPRPATISAWACCTALISSSCVAQPSK